MDPADFTQEISPTDMRVGGLYKMQDRTRTDIVRITGRETSDGLVKVSWTSQTREQGLGGAILTQDDEPNFRVFKRPFSSSPAPSSGLAKTALATMIVGVTSLVGIGIYRARSGL